MTAEMAGKINNKLCGNYWFHSNGVVHRQQVEFLKHCSQCIPNAVLNLQNNFTIKLKVNPNRKLKIQPIYDYTWPMGLNANRQLYNLFHLIKTCLRMQSYCNGAELQAAGTTITQTTNL